MSWRRGRRSRARSLSFAHNSHRRFPLIAVACWVVGFFGLAGGRFSLIQLAIAGAAVGVWVVAGARRRRIQLARERWIKAAMRPSSPVAHVRRLGNDAV